MITVWALWVFVLADGEWREWRSYPTKASCEQISSIFTRYREDHIQTRCVAKLVND